MKQGAWIRFCAIAAGSLWLLSGTAGCGGESGEKGRSAVAGIPPIAFLAQRIAGDRFQVSSLLPAGRSPHDYEPTPKEIRSAVLAGHFFSCGMPFEERILRQIAPGRNTDVSRGTEVAAFDGAEESHSHPGHSQKHENAHEHAEHHHEHGENDPHIWLSIANLRIIARNLAETFSAADPEYAPIYRKNLAALEAELSQLAQQINNDLSRFRGRSFFVYHPAFGHFAKMTGLRQIAVETGGRDPDPVHLKALIRKAHEEQVRVIFVQPQFNPGTARALASAIEGEVVPLDPLAPDVLENLRTMSRTLQGALTQK